MSGESCGICGGDGRIGNSFGLETSCPSCHGTGRRQAPTGFRDVTKTKPSHHLPTNKGAVAVKQTWPNTFEGGELAKAVNESKSCTAEVKSRLIREIMEHESTHGRCTQTFIKKTRRAAAVLVPGLIRFTAGGAGGMVSRDELLVVRWGARPVAER